MNYCFTSNGLFYLKLTYGCLVTESPFVRTAPEDQLAIVTPQVFSAFCWWDLPLTVSIFSLRGTVTQPLLSASA